MFQHPMKSHVRIQPLTLALLAMVVLLWAPLSSHAQDVTPTDQPDLTHLPVGDNKYSSTAPQVGYIYSCTSSYNGGGAFQEGPWFNGDGTFDLTTKAIVDGAVDWANHSFTIALNGDVRNITSNDLPNHPTGTYPIASSDDAYQYDRNPNSIAEQSLTYALPSNPSIASQPSCLNGGPIGILLTGSVLFNGLDAGGRDAVAHETLDDCQGHPEISGEYHYHNITSCLFEMGFGESDLIGYALDGFGIYGPRDENGNIITNADLDECHGRTSEVMWDGKLVTMYHYHATYEYPYTIGCYRGTPLQTGGQGGGQGGQQGGGQQGGQGGTPPAGGPQGGGQGGQQGGGQGGQQGGGQGGQQGGRPDLAAAAVKLGITEQQLRDALGAPPPDLAAAAAKLGITVDALRTALGVP